MRKEEQGRGALHITAHILAGALVSLLSGVAILVAAAWGISEGWIGEALTAQITVAACVFGGLVGGFSAARKHGSQRLVIGAAVGICFFLFLLSIGSLCCKTVAFGSKTLLIFFGCICGGTLSGVAAGKGKPSSKRKKKGSRSAGRRE